MGPIDLGKGIAELGEGASFSDFVAISSLRVVPTIPVVP